MPKINDDKQINIKSLEIQCTFLIKELQPCLKKQLHHQIITKCQKLINKNYLQLQQICAQIMLNLLLIQSKAAIKLLQKNVYKKYFYQQNTVKKLLKIINRNNTIFNAILVTKIKSKEILQDQISKMNSYDGLIKCNQFRNQILTKDFQMITKKFCQIYLSSVVYQLANFRIYKLPVQKCKGFHQYFDSLIKTMPNFSFKTQFSLISIKLSICKIIFQKSNYSRCMKLINRVIQRLLNLHFKIRLWYQHKQKSFFIEAQNIKSNKKQTIIKRYKHYMKRVTKLLITSIIMMIRINMLNSYQDLAMQGIKIFHFINQKCNIQMGHFRKYLNPQIYIYQQYSQYKAEKYQIQQIIQPLFANKIEQLRTNFMGNSNNNNNDNMELIDQLKGTINNGMVDFYNEKMVEFGQKMKYSHTKRQKLKRTANNNNKKLLQQNHQPSQSQLLQQYNNKIAQQNSKLTRKVRQNSIKSKHSTATTKNKHNSNINNLASSTIHTEMYSFTQNNNYQQQQQNNDQFNEDILNNMQQSLIDDIQQTTNRIFLTSCKKEQINNSQKCQQNQKIQKIKQNANKIQLSSSKKKQINNYMVQQQLDEKRSIENKQKSLKFAQKLISNIFNNNKSDKYLLNKYGHKQIVKNKKLQRQPLIKKKTQKQKSINIKQLNQKVHQIKQSLYIDLQKNIQLLRQKKNSYNILINKYSKAQNILFQPPLINANNEITSQFIDQKYQSLNGLTRKQLQSHSLQKRNSPLIVKNSSTMNINSGYKQKLKHLNRKTKLRMFIQLLTRNKQYFGVKKWSEKIQYIKKKQELKEKLRSTRKTTSINVNGLRGLSPKLNFIAGNVLMYSLQDIEQLNSSQKLQKRMTGALNVNNENNYRLGMKSIQILMNKLQKEKQSFSTKQNNNNKQKQLLLLSQRVTSATSNNNRMNTKTQRFDRNNNSVEKDNKNNRKNCYYGSSGSSSVGKLIKQNKNSWLCKFVL